MRIQAIQPTVPKRIWNYEPTEEELAQIDADAECIPKFTGYNSQLKKLWKAGKLPQVKYGFYGDKLTLNNCSVEHLKPVSKKGKTQNSNIVLASKLKNNNRGDKPLEMFLNLKSMTKYLEQFKNIIVDGFNGNEYIASILETVGKVLKKGE